MSTHPIMITVTEAPLERSRVTTFVRPLLAIPHVIWMYVWGLVAMVAFLLGWVAALITGRMRASLHDVVAGYLQYSARVTAYMSIMTDEFPPFSARGDYGVSLVVAGPEQQGRWGIFFRVLLAFPAIIINTAVSAAVGIGMMFFWVRVLFTGRVTRGLLHLMAYALRYQGQTSGYMLLLTDRYPDADPAPAGPLMASA